MPLGWRKGAGCRGTQTASNSRRSPWHRGRHSSRVPESYGRTLKTRVRVSVPVWLCRRVPVQGREDGGAKAEHSHSHTPEKLLSLGRERDREDNNIFKF